MAYSQKFAPAKVSRYTVCIAKGGAINMFRPAAVLGRGVVRGLGFTTNTRCLHATGHLRKTHASGQVQSHTVHGLSLNFT